MPLQAQLRSEGHCLRTASGTPGSLCPVLRFSAENREANESKMLGGNFLFLYSEPKPTRGVTSFKCTPSVIPAIFVHIPGEREEVSGEKTFSWTVSHLFERKGGPFPDLHFYFSPTVLLNISIIQFPKPDISGKSTSVA